MLVLSLIFAAGQAGTVLGSESGPEQEGGGGEGGGQPEEEDPSKVKVTMNEVRDYSLEEPLPLIKCACDPLCDGRDHCYTQGKVSAWIALVCGRD